MTKLPRPEAQRWGTSGWVTFASVLALLGLVASPFGDLDGRSSRVPTAAPTATPAAIAPVRPLSGATGWRPALSAREAVSAPAPAVEVASKTGAAAERVTPTGRSTATVAPTATTATTAGTADQPTFLQVDRWCSATTLLLSTSTWPDCPERSTTTDLWQAAADAGMRGSSMFVSASARAPAGTILGTSQASASWAGRALRTSGEGGLLRVRLTGVSGGVEPTCSPCAITVSASVSISVGVSYVGSDGGMVRQWSSCYFWSGEPVPAAVTVPDDCMPGEAIGVPPRTPIWVDLWLDAQAHTGSGPEASAALDVASATLDLP